MSKLYESALMQASREPSEIDEVTDDLTYIGYFDNGNSTKCLVKKIEKIGTVTTFTYPNGSLSFDQDWADRAILNYLHKR